MDFFRKEAVIAALRGLDWVDVGPGCDELTLGELLERRPNAGAHYQCKQIVEAHGGRIEVESREGAGTVFTVVVPGSSLRP